MTDEPKFSGWSGADDSDSLSEPLTRMVRDAYAPPAASDVYWMGLEQRIMARVKTDGAGDTRWWSVLAPWAQAGLIAATAIFAVSSVINRRIADSESQYAYESVIKPATPDVDASASLLSARDKAAETDATLDYVLSH